MSATTCCKSVRNVYYVREDYLENCFFALNYLLTSKSQDNLGPIFIKHSGTVLRGIQCDTKFFKLLTRRLSSAGSLSGQLDVSEDFCAKVRQCF